MGKAEDYHRDIYSGMVARELASEGYFGDECRLYGFISWIDGEKRFVAAAKEEECARAYVAAAERGELATPYMSCGVRVYEPEKMAETMTVLREKVYDCVIQTYGRQLEEKIHVYKQGAIHAEAEDRLRNYYSSMDAVARKEKTQALRWLAGYAKMARLISRRGFNFLMELLPETGKELAEYQRELSGFAWRVDGEWRYYANAFLPTVVEKMIRTQKEGLLVSGIVGEKYGMGPKPAYELKAEFQIYLRSILDDAYLGMLSDLANMTEKSN